MTNPLFNIDFYKADHRRQYPKGTSLVYSNFTARGAKHFQWDDFDDRVVFFGLNGAIQRINAPKTPKPQTDLMCCDPSNKTAIELL